MEDFETHPRGTGEVLRQLRAEREALTLQVEEQRMLLEQAQSVLQNWTSTDDLDRICDDIHQHLKGKE